MVQPLMFNDGSGRFWRLKKALYGLNQVAREWNRVLAKLLSDLGFERCASDPASYVSKFGRCFIFLWVDVCLSSMPKINCSRWSTNAHNIRGT